MKYLNGQTYIVNNAQETQNLAAEYALRAQAGDIFCLLGDLGAGKTVFARGLARGLGYTDGVTSPTFTLMNIYEGGRLPIYHFDLYRLTEDADLESIGCEEYFDAGGICVLEWPQRALPLLGKTWEVEIRLIHGEDENKREIKIRENIGD